MWLGSCTLLVEYLCSEEDSKQVNVEYHKSYVESFPRLTAGLFYYMPGMILRRNSNAAKLAKEH